MNTTYSGSIELTKMKSALRTMKNKAGQQIKVVILPVDDNYMEEKEGRVYLSVNCVIRDEPDQYDQHGFIAHKAASKIWKEANEEEREAMKDLKILGNVRNFGSNSAPSDPVYIADDISDDMEKRDLPF